MDKLLADVKAEYEPQKHKQVKPQVSEGPKIEGQPAKDKGLDELLQQVKSEAPHYVPMQLPSHSQPLRDKGLDGLLDQVKSEVEEQERIEILKQQEQLKEEARKQERLKQQKRAALNQQAVEWLKRLDPLSDEGFWFEQLVEKYPSRLDAAIAYLEAMQENSSEK